jgi:hypothetical protein
LARSSGTLLPLIVNGSAPCSFPCSSYVQDFAAACLGGLSRDGGYFGTFVILREGTIRGQIADMLLPSFLVCHVGAQIGIWWPRRASALNVRRSTGSIGRRPRPTSTLIRVVSHLPTMTMKSPQLGLSLETKTSVRLALLNAQSPYCVDDSRRSSCFQPTRSPSSCSPSSSLPSSVGFSDSQSEIACKASQSHLLAFFFCARALQTLRHVSLLYHSKVCTKTN